MAKLTILILFFSMLGANSLLAQTKNEAEITKIARQDARQFKLEKPLLKEWRKTKNATSDYFKPTTSSTKEVALLNDSTYVKEFKAYAHDKTSMRLSTGRWALIVGAAIAGAATLVIIVVTTTKGKPIM